LERYAPCHRALRLVHSLVAVLDEALSGPDAWKVKNALRLSGHSDLEKEARKLTARVTTEGSRQLSGVPLAIGSQPLVNGPAWCHWCGAAHAGPTDDPIVGVDRT